MGVCTRLVEQLSWFLALLVAFYQRTGAGFSNSHSNCFGTERDSSIGWGEWVNETVGIVWLDASTHPSHQLRHDGPTVEEASRQPVPTYPHISQSVHSPYHSYQVLSVTAVTVS